MLDQEVASDVINDLFSRLEASGATDVDVINVLCFALVNTIAFHTGGEYTSNLVPDLTRAIDNAYQLVCAQAPSATIN